MQKLNILNYPIYSFNCDQTLVDEVLADVKEKKFHPIKDEGSNLLMSPNYYHENLFCFFDKCVDEIKRKYFKESLMFTITDCWVNKYTMMQVIRNHTHSNSFISGLFYLTNHEKSGATCFSVPDPWTESTHNEYQNITVHNTQQYIRSDVYPTAGTLLLFPSQVYHHTKTVNSPDQVRYTISFNCFPSGLISAYKSGQLHLQVLSVKDRIKLGK